MKCAKLSQTTTHMCHHDATKGKESPHSYIIKESSVMDRLQSQSNEQISAVSKI